MSTPPSASQVMVSSGIHVQFTVGGTSILTGWKVKDVSTSGITIDQAEITNQLSADGFKEYVPLMADSGDVTINCYYDPTLNAVPDEATIRGAIREGAQGTLTLTYAVYASSSDTTGTATTFFECEANLQSCGNLSAALNNVIMTDLKFKLSGKPTIGGEA